MSTNHSNSGDKVVKLIRVYASGRVRAAAPRAHALPDEKPTPTTAPAAHVKDPNKVAAGKARAKKAAEAKAQAAKKAPAKKAKSAPHAGKKTPAKKAKPKAPAKKAAAPAKVPGPNAMVVIAFRVTKQQKRKLEKLGGATFVRDRIDRASA